ncbi:MAG: DsbA family protein [Arachnia sp.]
MPGDRPSGGVCRGRFGAGFGTQVISSAEVATLTRSGAAKNNTTPYKVAIVILAVTVVGLLAVLTRGGGLTAEPVATVTVTAPGAEGSNTQDPAAETDEVAGNQSDEQAEFFLSLPRRQADDSMAKGDVDATVVLTEWADYRCPFCNVWAVDVLPHLQPYIDDGTLRIEFRDMAIFGEDSIKAAAAARAAGQEGLFWEFTEGLYGKLPQSGHPDITAELLREVATEVGVTDLDAFEAYYSDPEVIAAVEADTAEGQALGITSTPTFLIGTQVVSGAQPQEVFAEVIEAEAAKLA